MKASSGASAAHFILFFVSLFPTRLKKKKSICEGVRLYAAQMTFCVARGGAQIAPLLGVTFGFLPMFLVILLRAEFLRTGKTLRRLPLAARR